MKELEAIRKAFDTITKGEFKDVRIVSPAMVTIEREMVENQLDALFNTEQKTEVCHVFRLYGDKEKKYYAMRMYISGLNAYFFTISTERVDATPANIESFNNKEDQIREAMHTWKLLMRLAETYENFTPETGIWVSDQCPVF